MRISFKYHALYIVPLCIVVVFNGSKLRTHMRDDEAAKVSGLKGNALKYFEANMDSAQSYDKQTFGSKDVSAEEAKRMSTHDLLKQVIKIRLYLLSFLYEDDGQIGIYRASRCSNSMAELLNRKDFATAWLQIYSPFDVDPRTHPHFEDDGGTQTVFYLSSMLLYPSIQDKLAGHEKDILLAMCKKYWEIKKVNNSYPVSAKYPKGHAIYGGWAFSLEPAQLVAKRVFPNALINSIQLPEQLEPALRQLEQLCNH